MCKEDGLPIRLQNLMVVELLRAGVALVAAIALIACLAAGARAEENPDSVRHNEWPGAEGGFPPAFDELSASARVHEREDASRIVERLRAETASFVAFVSQADEVGQILACSHYLWQSYHLNEEVNDAQFSTETQELLWAEFTRAIEAEREYCHVDLEEPVAEPDPAEPDSAEPTESLQATAPPDPREARIIFAPYLVSTA